MSVTGKRHQSPGERIKDLRMDKGLSQEELVGKVNFYFRENNLNKNFSQEMLSRYESGKIVYHNPAVIDAMAKVFETDKEYILGEIDKLAHLSNEARTFVENPESSQYIERALLEYLKDKFSK